MSSTKIVPPCRECVVASATAACLCLGSAFAQSGGPVLAPYDWVGSCGQMLFDPEGFDRDTFGSSIASDGEWLLIGSAGDDTACPFEPLCDSGSAYFFRRQSDGRYVQWQKVVPDDIARYHNTAQSVAIQGTTAMVYRNNELLGGPYGAGEVMVYALGADQWQLVDSIRSGDALQSLGFGFVFEWSGDVLAARTTHLDADGRPVSLAIEMFRKIDGEWTYQDTVRDPLGRSRAQWIDHIALLPDGTLVVSDYEDSTLFPVAGIVRIFEPVDGRWELTQELFPDDGRFHYGRSLSADTGRIVVGHPNGLAGGVSGGRVDVYERGGDAWELMDTITLDQPHEGDALGWQVELNGDRLLTLATRRLAAVPEPRHGSWLIFDFTGGRWHQRLESIRPPSPLHGSSIHLELDGDTAFIGHETWAPTPDLLGVGSVFAYDVACLSCAPDLDADGALTVFDFLMFFNAFDAGDLMIADFDGDGELTLFDFLAFQTAFDAGCG